MITLGLLVVLISCKNETEVSRSEGLKIDDTGTSQELELDRSEIKAVVEALQGKWKESEYPFRQAEFKASRVKFVEEGVAEAPEFQKYRISEACPFEVNNMKNVGPDDLILALVESETCEKLKISKNTLTLSGFNTSTGSEYRIVYGRVQ